MIRGTKQMQLNGKLMLFNDAQKHQMRKDGVLYNGLYKTVKSHFFSKLISIVDNNYFTVATYSKLMEKLGEVIGTFPYVYNQIEDIECMMKREGNVAPKFILSALASKYF